MAGDEPEKDDPAPVHEEGVETLERTETTKPKLYKVLLHNDDYTTMEFVVAILMDVFHKPRTMAEQIMYQVHVKGVGVAGVYTRDIAETKVSHVLESAREAGMPLMCTAEPEE